MSHLTQSGMPKGKPFPENELVWLDCPECEYHVRVHQSTQEANMRQHKEKGCPLVTTGDETPEVENRSPLELQAPLCAEPCEDCECLTVSLPSNWPYCARKCEGKCYREQQEHVSRKDSSKVEPPPSHSWEPLSKALSDEEKEPPKPKWLFRPDEPSAFRIYPNDTEARARTFDTGATRDTDDGKYDYEGFFSPLVLERFAEYMHYHRYQSDGTLRDSDNWQRGIPLDEYMKSGFRHFMDWWLIHRGNTAGKDDVVDVLCALLFNVQGYLHELLRACDSKADEGQYR